MILVVEGRLAVDILVCMDVVVLDVCWEAVDDPLGFIELPNKVQYFLTLCISDGYNVRVISFPVITLLTNTLSDFMCQDYFNSCQFFTLCQLKHSTYTCTCTCMQCKFSTNLIGNMEFVLLNTDSPHLPYIHHLQSFYT